MGRTVKSKMRKGKLGRAVRHTPGWGGMSGEPSDIPSDQKVWALGVGITRVVLIQPSHWRRVFRASTSYTAALSRTGRVAGPWLGSTPQVEMHMLLRAKRPQGALCKTKAIVPSPSSGAKMPIRRSVCHACPPQPGEVTLPCPPPTHVPLNKSAS